MALAHITETYWWDIIQEYITGAYYLKICFWDILQAYSNRISDIEQPQTYELTLTYYTLYYEVN